MWKWVGVGVEGIIGVPATDLTDEEFVKYNARVNAQHSADQRGALINSGLYEHVEDEKPTRRSKGANEEDKEESSTSANTATVEKPKDEDKKDE